MSVRSGRYAQDYLDLEYVSLSPVDSELGGDDELRMYLDLPADFDTYFHGARDATVTLQNNEVLNADLMSYCGQPGELAVWFHSSKKGELSGYPLLEPVTVTCLE